MGKLNFGFVITFKLLSFLKNIFDLIKKLIFLKANMDTIIIEQRNKEIEKN